MACSFGDFRPEQFYVGMAGFVMANGALAVSGKEGEVRKRHIRELKKIRGAKLKR